MRKSRKQSWKYPGIAIQTRNTSSYTKLYFPFLIQKAYRPQLSKYNNMDSNKRRKLHCLSLYVQFPLVTVCIKPGAKEKSGWWCCSSGGFLGGTADLNALTETVMQELWPHGNIRKTFIALATFYLFFWQFTSTLELFKRNNFFFSVLILLSISRTQGVICGAVSNHTFNTHFSGPWSHRLHLQRVSKPDLRKQDVWNHRITKWFGLGETFRDHLAQPLCHAQVHPLLDQVAQSPIWSDFEHS